MSIKRDGDTIHFHISYGWLLTLALIFVVMQIAGIISWPWYWLLAPLWLPIAFMLGIVGAILVVVLFVAAAAGIVAGTIALIEGITS